MTAKIFSILILSIIISFSQCAPDGHNHQSNKTNSLVDSLVHVNHINDKSIMVQFGSDAIVAINTENGIVVIDAGISTGLTSKYRDLIVDEFHSDDFAYVINTHAHHDHNRGNSVFSTSKIVGHENGLNEIEEHWKDPQNKKESTGKIVEEYRLKLEKCEQNSEDWYDAYKQKIRYQYAFNDIDNLIPIKKPDITFSDSLNIDMSDITFELKYFGKCHSESDILIYVPELKMLFTGDLMFNYGKPSINDDLLLDKNLWIESIAWIEKRMDNIEIVIGGHGQILSIEDLKSFNRKILEQIDERT